MDDPVLRGRVIAVVIGVFFAGGVTWCLSRGQSDAADPGSETHKRLIESGCERGGLERDTPPFLKCVQRATVECGGGGGVGRNISTCAAAIANQE